MADAPEPGFGQDGGHMLVEYGNKVGRVAIDVVVGVFAVPPKVLDAS